ncbi:MAG TPA: alpha/beta fold hydrolase [Gemmatimonas sp.]|nr:alpha/beta fold hydrolase [Gemmatimonas sp.]
MRSRRLLASGIATAAAMVGLAAWRRRVRNQFEGRHAGRFSLSGDGIVRGAEPILLPGSRTHAVLLLHGFNDTPQSVSALAHALHTAGWTVYAPLLPGHGRTLREMAEGRAEAWRAHTRESYDGLRAQYDTVVVSGQSMGAALAVELATEVPEIPALVLLAPFIGVPTALSLKFTATWLLQSLAPYSTSTGGERSIHDPDARALALGAGVVTARLLHELRAVAKQAQSALPAVTMPVLYLQSREDNRIRAIDAERNFRLLGSTERVQRWLSGCGHIISADYCREEVARQTHEWFSRWVGAPAAATAGASP